MLQDSRRQAEEDIEELTGAQKSIKWPTKEPYINQKRPKSAMKEPCVICKRALHLSETGLLTQDAAGAIQAARELLEGTAAEAEQLRGARQVP